jgi:hypothetical protein
MRRRPVIAIAAFRPLVVGVLVSVAAVLGGCGGLSCDDYTFPAEVWKATNYEVKNSEDELRERRRAADALVKCKLIANMSKRRVKALLGRPHEQNGDRWLYVVGPERAFVQIDDETLIVEFRHNRVIDVSDPNVD